MDFDAAFERLIGNEGGYTADPHDRGNWTGGAVGHGELRGTKYGISAMSYPTLDIANLSLDDAKRIYLKSYWAASGAGLLADQPGRSGANFDVFDMAVNSGVTSAIKTLQQACGVPADGVMGNQTVAAAQAMDPQELRLKFNAYRLIHFTESPVWETYGKGWITRVANNMKGV